jgi:hypothetical protein
MLFAVSISSADASKSMMRSRAVTENADTPTGVTGRILPLAFPLVFCAKPSPPVLLHDEVLSRCRAIKFHSLELLAFCNQLR